MKRLAAITLCIGLSLLIGTEAYGQKGGTTGHEGGRNTNHPTPAPTPPPREVIAKYVTSASSTSMLAVRLVVATTGANLELPAETSYSDGKQVPSSQVQAIIKASEPGDYFKVSVATVNGRQVIKKMDRYTLKPGEDEPNVYVFEGVKEEKVNNRPTQFVTATKFEQSFKFQVPPGRDPVTSKPAAANPDIMATVGSFKSGDSVEIVSIKAGQAATLKSIKAYQPPKEAQFSKVTTTKLADKEVPALEVQIDGQAQTLPLLPTASQAIRSKVGSMKADTKILIKTETDAKGTTYISDLRLSPAKPAAKAV